jgi:hypothetical protein
VKGLERLLPTGERPELDFILLTVRHPSPHFLHRRTPAMLGSRSRCRKRMEQKEGQNWKGENAVNAERHKRRSASELQKKKKFSNPSQRYNSTLSCTAPQWSVSSSTEPPHFASSNQAPSPLRPFASGVMSKPTSVRLLWASSRFWLDSGAFWSVLLGVYRGGRFPHSSPSRFEAGTRRDTSRPCMAQIASAMFIELDIPQCIYPFTSSILEAVPTTPWSGRN